MPPTRRTRKVGLKRMDAALDALRPMGFADTFVRRTVRNLLKAYGGDDGWTFIEECSYKLLIDTILEELENNEPNLLLENGNNEPKLLLENGSSKDSIMHSAQPMDIMQSSLTNDEPDEKLGVQVHSSANVESVLCPMEDETSHVELERQLPSPHISSARAHSPPALCTPLLVNSIPSQRRKPCYGWLSSDDEEEPDLVSLVPAT